MILATSAGNRHLISKEKRRIHPSLEVSRLLILTTLPCLSRKIAEAGRILM